MNERRVSILAVVAAGAGLLLVTQSASPTLAQTITFGPNGVHVSPNSPDGGQDGRPDDHRDYRNYDNRDGGDRYDHRDREHSDYRRDDRWDELRDRMREYRDECRDGDRGACVRLGIVIGENQARSDDWRREHPSYFWWDHD